MHLPVQAFLQKVKMQSTVLHLNVLFLPLSHCASALYTIQKRLKPLLDFKHSHFLVQGVQICTQESKLVLSLALQTHRENYPNPPQQHKSFQRHMHLFA